MRTLISAATFAVINAALLAPRAAQDGYQWFSERYLDADIFQSQVYLFHGIPQTDAIQFIAQCAIGNSGTYAIVNIEADVGTSAAGQVVDVQFAGSKFSRILTGNVFIYEEGSAGVTLAIELNDPLWQAIEDLSVLNYNVTGLPTTTLSLVGSRAPTSQFLSDCRGGMVPETTPKPAGQETPILADDGCDAVGSLRSLGSGAPATITFINDTDGYRAIMWIDFDGNPQLFGGVNPGESLVQSTFVGHPWMITDGPGNCLEVYQPPAGQSFYSMTATGNFGPE